MKLISTYHILNDRKYNQILLLFKITVIFHHITAKRSRCDIYESNQFLYSDTSMC